MLAGSRIDPLELDNVRQLFGLPLLGDLISSRNAFDEGFRAHRAFDLERSEVIGEVEKPTPVFDVRNLFANIHAVVRCFLNPRHAHSPRPNSERLWSERGNLNESNLVSRRVNGVTVPLLSTAFFLRPTVEQFRVVTAETNSANDNWHPLEAA